MNWLQMLAAQHFLVAQSLSKPVVPWVLWAVSWGGQILWWDQADHCQVIYVTLQVSSPFL